MAQIEQQLRADLKAAMKAQDTVKKDTLRMALAALLYAKTAGDEAVELTDADELKVLTKEHRNRLESAKTYADAGRDELAAKEQAEATILEAYLPQPLSEDELTRIVNEELAACAQELGSTPTMKNMGAIVKAVNARVQGRAEGKTVASMVRAGLS